MKIIEIVDKNYDYIVVGAGFSGAIAANHFASLGKQVLLIEKRDHIAGNMYDYLVDGILTHKYGPHILYFNEQRVFDFLSKYSELVSYKHKVYANVDNDLLALPINLNSLKKLFTKNYEDFIFLVQKEFPDQERLTIHQLLNSRDVKKYGIIIYNKIFYHYSKKMWGTDPKNLDPFVMERIPIKMNNNDDHFNHKFQFMPSNGYTKLFENILSSDNIDVLYKTNFVNEFSVKNNMIYFNRLGTTPTVIFTGPIDELFNYKYGVLNYRSLNIKIEKKEMEFFQTYSVVNYPDDRPYTRITDMKRLNCQNIISKKTVIITEFPGQFDDTSDIFGERYYPMPTTEDHNKFNKYKEMSEKIVNLHLLGRLATYKYINMETTILEALDFLKKI